MSPFVAQYRLKIQQQQEKNNQHIKIFLHYLLFTISFLSLIYLMIYNLKIILFWQWFVIPVSFLVANFVEYLMHRFPMHNKYKFLNNIYQKHTIDHHLYFRNDDVIMINNNDWIAIPAPWRMIFIFILFIALPIMFMVYLLLGTNPGLLFGITILGYYIIYEWIHLLIHWLPFVNKIIGKHHSLHHNTKLMRKYNFNVIFPICDLLFKTYKK